jgi:hypothetical protein
VLVLAPWFAPEPTSYDLSDSCVVRQDLHGWTQVVVSYDFVDDDGDSSDRPVGADRDGNGLRDQLAGHGTHVAGIVHFVAPAAKIVLLRVLDSAG